MNFVCFIAVNGSAKVREETQIDIWVMNKSIECIWHPIIWPCFSPSVSNNFEIQCEHTRVSLLPGLSSLFVWLNALNRDLNPRG